MMRWIAYGLLLLCGLQAPAWAGDGLATAKIAGGESFSYLLTTSGPQKPTYAVILMPGGAGHLNPHLEGVRPAFAGGGNFLIRSRATFAEGPFVAASTDATTTPERILAIVQDLESRYGKLAVYVIGTSNSTGSTMTLAVPLDGKVAGFVHTSSLNRIASFDPRNFKSRHLIVLNRQDACKSTKPANGEASHRSYGTELIVMDGGKSTDDDCQPFAFHGYNGIERETVEKIKAWITRAPS